MTGGKVDRPATRNPQIQHGLHDKPGCEDGIRRGQALSGIRRRDGGSVGRDARRPGIRVF